MKEQKYKECPECQGEGRCLVCGCPGQVWVTCETCNGEKRIPDEPQGKEGEKE
jgi:DnaJ-class molecular chaperone